MSIPLDPRLLALLDELDAAHRYTPYARRAEELGEQNLAKLFRALDVSEIARERLLRKHVADHVRWQHEYAVCPNCGLIFAGGVPEQCPVDGTLPGEFEQVR